jgi:peptidase E
MGFMEREFKEFGHIKINHAVITPTKADLNKANDILKAADVIFAGGGDPEAGVQILREKKMIDILHDLHQEGKVFFGISAGSIMLAKEWVRWRDPDNDATAELFPCLNIAPVICDTHDEEAGFIELKTAIALARENIRGYGLASNTGIKVYPDGNIEALGGAVWQFSKRRGKVERESDLQPINTK